jgi:hypothetical protein
VLIWYLYAVCGGAVEGESDAHSREDDADLDINRLDVKKKEFSPNKAKHIAHPSPSPDTYPTPNTLNNKPPRMDEAAAELFPTDAIKQARELWLRATSTSELEQVESLYRQVLSSKSPSEDDETTEEPAKKKRKGHLKLCRSDYLRAGEKLALLLCQSGRCKKAKKPLTLMGFKCRLAESVLNYPTDISMRSESNNLTPCQIVDGFLTDVELEKLRSVFSCPSAHYWTSHNYQVEPPSPYFSYVVPLSEIRGDKQTKANDFGFIGNLIEKVLVCPMLTEKFSALSTETQFVEMWAHNRPHASGHQMHFDSDDEGRGGVRNPIISTILYITGNDDGEDSNTTTSCTGGPSLITNQKLGDTNLATHGWMAHPKPKRLVAFDGRYLHGVVPGKGVSLSSSRRVTLMFAFWKNVQIRRGLGPGSARPFPMKRSNNKLPEWAKLLSDSIVGDNKTDQSGYETCQVASPVELEVVYESLDGKPWKKSKGMPSYDEVFQGF